jgi:hypothetical protein
MARATMSSNVASNIYTEKYHKINSILKLKLCPSFEIFMLIHEDLMRCEEKNTARLIQSFLQYSKA